MDDIRYLQQKKNNEKELEILRKTISQCVKMEFCIEKCAMLIMKSGKS